MPFGQMSFGHKTSNQTFSFTNLDFVLPSEFLIISCWISNYLTIDETYKSRSLNSVWPDWATSRHLGYFLLNQFSPKRAVSTMVCHTYFKVSKVVLCRCLGIKIWCVCFGIFGYFSSKFCENLFHFLVTLHQVVFTWVIMQYLCRCCHQ
jgi:hypothetical protein